ncbi:DUF4145 domain-containing protein [Kocuria sp. CPCC 205300]|uniref:DUF4145 domain-containing protein n=1 Tax=Kocuria sabuli TaxID=3071448 RepID=UPI0036DC7AAB
MPPRYIAPEFEAPVFTCPFCHAYSTVRWVALMERTGEWGNSAQFGQFGTADPDAPEGEGWSPWSASVCPACQGVTFWWEGVMQHPQKVTYPLDAPLMPEDMPDVAKPLYEEAAAVLPHSRRAAAALCRATLDVMTKELLPTGAPKQLDQRLAILADRVTTPTYQLLHVIRHVGNKSLHDGVASDDAVVRFLEGVDPAATATYFRAIVDLVDELVTKPRLAEEAFAELPVTVRERIPTARPAADTD